MLKAIPPKGEGLTTRDIEFNDCPAKAGRLVLGINAAIQAKASLTPDQSGSSFIPLSLLF